VYPDRPLRGVCVCARVCVCVCWSVWQTIDHGFAGTSGGGGAAAAGMEAAAMMACTCLQVKRLLSCAPLSLITLLKNKRPFAKTGSG
jgi:hypothetical protein